MIFNKADLNAKFESGILNSLPAEHNPGVYANLINSCYRTSYVPYSRRKGDPDVRRVDFPAAAPRDSRCTR